MVAIARRIDPQMIGPPRFTTMVEILKPAPSTAAEGHRGSAGRALRGRQRPDPRRLDFALRHELGHVVGIPHHSDTVTNWRIVSGKLNVTTLLSPLQTEGGAPDFSIAGSDEALRAIAPDALLIEPGPARRREQHRCHRPARFAAASCTRPCSSQARRTRPVSRLASTASVRCSRHRSGNSGDGAGGSHRRRRRSRFAPATPPRRRSGAATVHVRRLLFRHARYADAQRAAEALLRAEPRRVGAHVLRGDALAGLNQKAAALESYRRALKLMPRSRETPDRILQRIDTLVVPQRKENPK